LQGPREMPDKKTMIISDDKYRKSYQDVREEESLETLSEDRE